MPVTVTVAAGAHRPLSLCSNLACISYRACCLKHRNRDRNSQRWQVLEHRTLSRSPLLPATSSRCTHTSARTRYRRRAYNQPWAGSKLRYVGDARPFWSHIVAESTGSANPELAEDLWQYYLRPEAW